MTTKELKEIIASRQRFIASIGDGAVKLRVEEDIKRMQAELVEMEQGKKPESADQTTDDELEKLRAECTEKGITFHARAGKKKLTELLSAHND
jgi:uncharacterized protein YdaU (DUF1376 family)